MKLKDYQTKKLYSQGKFGLCIRINNDTEDLNKCMSIPECIKEIKQNPDVKNILESEIVSQRDFFDVKVLVIDYKNK